MSTSTTPVITEPSSQQRSSHAAADQFQSSVHIWLDGIEKPLALLKKDSMTTPSMPYFRAPFQSTQPKATSHSYFLRRGSSKSITTRKRKIPMDEEDDSRNHGVERRGSGRINTSKTRKATTCPQEGNQSEIHNKRNQAPRQPRCRGRPSKNATTTGPRRVLGDIDDTEGDASEGAGANLPLRNDRIILGNSEIPQVLPSLSPTRTGTTRTSSRSSSSLLKRIKRENLVNLSPVIEFKTVAKAKEYLPSQVQSLWRDRISSLVHETRVVPPQLKVSGELSPSLRPF
jgi:hypothetical protein